MNRKELEKLACELLRLRLGVAKLTMMGNKAALVERLYLHLQDPSSEPEPEHDDVPDTTTESEDSSESSSEGATTESTLYIFNLFASVLHWIMATNYAADLIHYLDDFLLAGPPGQPTCSESTETMLRVCERLGIPVALDKLEGPATTITFLGITIDTTLQQLRLPPDKLQDISLFRNYQSSLIPTGRIQRPSTYLPRCSSAHGTLGYGLTSQELCSTLVDT